MINIDLGDNDGVLMFDESAFPKKGNQSVGAARQYCGTTGKIENCQVGVFAGYASCHGYSLVSSQLFIPEVWFTKEYALKRKKCEMPPELTFKTKPQIAAEILKKFTIRVFYLFAMLLQIQSMAIVVNFVQQ